MQNSKTRPATHGQLIEFLHSTNVIKSQLVYYTMLSIDYKYFVLQQPYYADKSSSLGYGSIISAPHMHAYALQHMLHRLKTAKNVLDVGSGSGYMLAAMAIIAGKQTTLYGIEHVQELVDMSVNNITKLNSDLLKRMHIKCGDGRQGWKFTQDSSNIKFDVIHVGAACEEIPHLLVEQLSQGGVMIIPIGKQLSTQTYTRVTKKDNKIALQKLQYVCYVPLTSLSYQKIR